MNKVIFIGIFLAATWLTSFGLDINAYYFDANWNRGSGVAPTNRCEIHVNIFLKNTSNIEILVPKANIGPALCLDDKGNASVLYSCGFEKFDGSVVKPSLYEFIPVKLMPGEMACMEYLLAVPYDQDLNKVSFEYEVPPDIASAYGFWTGNVKCKLKLWAGTRQMNPSEPTSQPTHGEDQRAK